MAGIRMLRKAQIGLESSAGTAVAATAIYRGLAVIDDQSKPVFPVEDVGYLSGTNRAYIPKTVVNVSMPEHEATFEQLGYVLSAGVEDVVTGTSNGGTTNGYTYLYTFPTTAAKTLKVVQCTMIAPWAIDSVTFDPLTYADVHASVWRGKLCSMSADVRVDPTVDEYFELYGGSNLGWGVSDDGDAEDPETDEANGDPTLYVDDPQHFSNAGHLLEFGLVRDAFLEAVAIPPTINLRGFSLPLAQPAY